MNKVRRYGTSKVVLVKEYDIGQDCIVLSSQEYHELIKNKYIQKMARLEELKTDLRRAKLDKEKSLKDFEYYSKEVILLEEAIREVDI